MEWLDRLWKSAKPKLDETKDVVTDKWNDEVAQFREMGGFSEYVAQNLTTLVSKGAKSLGREDWAEAVEEKRGKIVEKGKGLDDRVKEEYAQYQSMDGFSEYVAQNVVTLASEGAKLLGREDWAKTIEAKRGDVLEKAKSLDGRVKEEYAQYQSMGGFSEYVTQNVVTLASEGAKLLGREDWAEAIEANRGDILEKAITVDSKVKDGVNEVLSKLNLREELKQQKSGTQKLTGQYALADAKLSIKANKSSENESVAEEKQDKFERKLDGNEVLPRNVDSLER